MRKILVLKYGKNPLVKVWENSLVKVWEKYSRKWLGKLARNF